MADTLLDADPAPSDAPLADPSPAPAPSDAPAPSSEAPAPSDTPSDPPADEKPVEATWPEDWREKLAGDDADLLRDLKRYSSPTTVAKALKDAKALIRSGKLKRDMPDASDEKGLAEWRKEQGIPDKPEAYKAPTIKGFEWTDNDRPVMAGFFEHAHTDGLPQSAVDSVLKWYANTQQQIAERTAEADNAARESAEDSLRKDWGGEYRANLTLASRFLETTPLGAEWAEARLPDGRALGNLPEFVRWAADMGRDTYGADGPFATGDAIARASSERQELENLMKTDYPKFMKEGGFEKMVRLREQEQKRRR